MERKGPVLIMDGGLSTALEQRIGALDPILWSAAHIFTHGPEIQQCMAEFIAAGCQMITMPTYQLSSAGLVEAGFFSDDLSRFGKEAFAIAARARDQSGQLVKIAASVGPFGAYLHDGSEYSGQYGCSPGDLVHFHEQRFQEFDSYPIDLLLCETIPNKVEIEILLELAAQAKHPVWLSLSLSQPEQLADGTPLRVVFASVEKYPSIQAIGANCFPPEWVKDTAKVFSTGPRPFFLYPNSGESWDAARKQWMGAVSFADHILQLENPSHGPQKLVGIGGCCRVTAEAMSRLVHVF